MKTLFFKYIFQFEDKTSKKYTIELDPKTLKNVKASKELEGGNSYPVWTDLEYHQCKNCPLNKTQSPQCPVAKNIYLLVEHFKHEKSITPAKVFVDTPKRMFMKDTTVQDGLASILGLIMATSECPHFYFLRPMARYHLPFATDEETTFRSVSVYLLGQFFRKQQGKTVDWDLKKLTEGYEELGTVNMGLASRIRNVARGDADKNAISILSTLGMIISSGISTQLEDLAYQVEPFLERLQD